MTPSAEVNLLFGENGQGKTSLIEALWMFSAGTSFRTARIAELVGFDCAFARLTLRFFCGGRSQEASLALEKAPTKKLFKVEGIERRANSEELDLPMVLFQPDDLELVKAGPQERRALLDTVLVQMLPRYRKNLAEYNRCLLQRNTLLKTMYKQRGKQNNELLDVLDVALAKLGVYLTRERRRLVERLGAEAARLYEGISGGREALTAEYRSGVFDTFPQEERQAWELAYYEAVCARRHDDLQAGFTTVGAHRDDLVLWLDGRPAKAFGSQGQQRTAAIACKLGSAGVLYEITGERPVVLLDDVFSELDDRRKQYILDTVTENQIFVTGCDVGSFSALTPAARAVRRFQVQAGRVAQVQSEA